MSYRTDERDRLRWVEQRIKGLITGWRADVLALRAGQDPEGCTLDSGEAQNTAGLADGYEETANAVEEILTASHAPGGPPVDHFAEITRHLSAIRDLLATAQAADAAGEPVLQRINQEIRDGLEIPPR